MKEAERKVASRAKMIFESGTLNPKREELYRNIMMFSEMRRDAKDESGQGTNAQVPMAFD